MENERTVLQAVLEVAQMIKQATTAPRWKTMIISLPAQPYRRPTDPPEAELYSAGALIREWSEAGWEPVCMVAQYELLLKKRMPPDLDTEPYDPAKAYAAPARKVKEIMEAVRDTTLPYDVIGGMPYDATSDIGRESA